MTRIERRIARLEYDMRKNSASLPDPTSPRHVWEWCVSEGARAPRPRPGETLAEWLKFVPDETLALMLGKPLTRHPMSRPSRADEERRERIEEHINAES